MPKSDFQTALTISDKEIIANRPEPIISDVDVFPYKRKIDPREAVDFIIDGNYVLVEDFYSSGLAVLSELKKRIAKTYSNQSFQGQRDFRSVFRELSNRLLLLVDNNKLTVKKAPQIGWLEILYPELDQFLLPFPQVQGLNSSWQWYEKGISIPVLDRKIYPFYGMYFPTRFEHLNLFEDWLKQYNGDKTSAIDVGIGSGILSLQMLKHGFEKIYGTDINPNSIIGINDDLKKNELSSKIELMHGDLFANCDIKTDLIVFNPPWLPASHNLDGIDKAIYYDEDLFPRFFAEAEKHLKPEGRVVIIFSNLAQVTNVTDKHPIEEELSNGGRFEKELFTNKEVGTASKNTKRNQNWRENEMVELWVLRLKDEK